MAPTEQVRQLVAADDRQDFEFASRGFIATRKDPVIKRGDGRVAYDISAYEFLTGAAPDTANPSLWRQAQILTMHGLFKVAERIFQVRGFDVSTVSFIDAGTGWIVVDPLTSVEAARAASNWPLSIWARSRFSPSSIRTAMSIIMAAWAA
jgi:alkyl sulfatase BDS1-like metallo-beta-lactamase superfamily hydrolase